jgi:hypothetical protein
VREEFSFYAHLLQLLNQPFRFQPRLHLMPRHFRAGIARKSRVQKSDVAEMIAMLRKAGQKSEATIVW